MSDFQCGPDGEVVDALVTVEISGGIPPYFVQFNSNNTIIEFEGIGIGFRLPGGTGAEVSLHDSGDGKRNETVINTYVPSHHSSCEGDDPTSTVIVSATNISTLVSTQVTYTSSVSAPAGGSNNFGNSTSTKKPIDNPPNPTATRFTPLPPTSTFTPLPPTSTFTPLPPTSTFTPMPSPTDTPIPGRPQCDDGIDNDGDGKIDKDDKECQNKHDDDESK